MTEKVLFTWSGGKDSVLALYEIQKRDDQEVAALLTTLTEGYDRISMHGVRSILLELNPSPLSRQKSGLYLVHGLRSLPRI